MAKTITLEYEGNTYTLEFTRNSMKELLDRGFTLEGLSGEKAVIMIPMLFEASFFAHHRYTKPNEIQKIYEAIPDKAGFLDALSQIFSAPYEDLMAAPKESAGNAKWGANF